MKKLLQLLRLACSARIALSAWRIALVVGSVLNAINQGGAIYEGKDVDWLHFLLNYLVPYCVASYSAAKNEMRESDE